MTPDVNLLVAASRSDHPQHVVARDWLADAAGSAQAVAPVTIQPMVSASFLRLVTHRKVFINPTPVEDAMHFIEALLGLPGVSMATLGDEWPVFRKLCVDKGLAANDLPDAWLAAAVLHQGEHLVTFDRDFRRLLTRSQFTLLLPV